jgi:hypothetical protein
LSLEVKGLMEIAAFPERLRAFVGGLSPFKRVVLALALSAFLVEVTLRLVAPRSRTYARWKAGMEAVGGFWTAILLSIVYFVSVAGLNLFSRLSGKDPLDRSLRPELTFWRAHEPNPLGPESAAKHQF